MYFIDKRKRNWIRKEDRVLDQVRPPGRVGYGGASPHSDIVNIQEHIESMSQHRIYRREKLFQCRDINMSMSRHHRDTKVTPRLTLKQCRDIKSVS